MIENLIITFGEPVVLCAAGALTGIVFGLSAQHSRFCLRAATVEFAALKIGPSVAVWLIAFSAAVAATQWMIVFNLFDSSEARQIASTGSMSGAIIGGLMFGVGMVLARGCASRLLVLSSTGNLRAIISGLVLTLVAQMSLTGALAPAREYLGNLWLVQGGPRRDLLTLLHISHGTAALIASLAVVIGWWLAFRNAVKTSRIIASTIVGLAVALGWLLTYVVKSNSFELVSITSVTFAGPSTDTLMTLVNTRDVVLSFSLGLVPGVFAGGFIAALATREFKIQRFGEDTPMERYLIGATLMGFGAMLAGGCAVGAGVSGGAIMATTAWIAVFFMWIGSVGTSIVMGWAPKRAPAIV